MDIWPKKEDRLPRQTRFWVNGVSGIDSCGISEESSNTIEHRLKNDYPLYRVLGSVTYKILLGKRSYEV